MNAEQAWQSALGQLQMQMTKASFDTWVRDTRFVSCDSETIKISVQNAYARDWLESRLSSTIIRLLTGLLGKPYQVEFVVGNYEPSAVVEEGVVEELEPVIERETGRVTINPRYTFGNFVVGNSNRLAHAACLAVGENPAKAYNPLFLYGGVGLGKTHLLHSIGNMCQQKGLQVLYVSSEEFTNDFISAIQKHTNAAFREKYRYTDVLLIDDIQFIANKEQTQEEFFHTFNTLHGQNKQIVISSDRPPKSLVTLEERLRSRFEWGLIGDIQPPDLETRIAILRLKAEHEKRDVPADVLEYLARQVQSNIRELEGAYNRVVAIADLIRQPMSVRLVNDSLVDLLPQRKSLSTDQVVSAVAESFGLETDMLTGRGRSQEVALPRQVAMYLMRQEANASLPQIGLALGGRDHTTVMYACDKVADLIERDDRLRRQVISIRENLYGRVPSYV